jgi:hypothetical protein
MKVLKPDALLREAAEVLDPVRDDVVVIGASAVRVALDGRDAVITPTRDVDAGTQTEAVERVVSELEKAGLTRSPEPHEQGFTWVRGTLKVQLIRPFHPFPKGAAARLPVNNVIPELAHHRVAVAFDDEPSAPRLWCADAAALIALKGLAFGRTQNGNPVDRDYADVVLLLDHLLDEIVVQVATDAAMRGRVINAAKTLLEEEEATAAAIRELNRTGAYPTAEAARRAAERAGARTLRALKQHARTR